MESGKQVMSSETSSEENNDRSELLEQVNRENESQTATKRSYECTYCKRGFTNAQALGGHMNIHRKDRAKAKQHSPVSYNNDYQNDQEIMSNFMANNNPPHFSSPAAAWYHPIDHNHRNMYFHQPSSGPSINASSFPYGYPNHHHHHHHHHEIASNRSSNEELFGADLSLQIDSARYLDNRDDHEEARPGLINDEVLDLELRLGHRY